MFTTNCTLFVFEDLRWGFCPRSGWCHPGSRLRWASRRGCRCSSSGWPSSPGRFAAWTRTCASSPSSRPMCAQCCGQTGNLIYTHHSTQSLIKYVSIKTYYVINTIHRCNKSGSYRHYSNSHEHKVRQLSVSEWGMSEQQTCRSAWQACLKLSGNIWTHYTTLKRMN